MATRLNLFGGKSIYAGSERINFDAPIVVSSGGTDIFSNATPILTPTGTTNISSTLARSLVPSGSGYNAKVMSKTVDNLGYVRASLDETRAVKTQCRVSFTANADAAGAMQRKIVFSVNGVAKSQETIELPSAKAAAYEVSVSHPLFLNKDDVVKIELVSTNAPAGSAISNTVVQFFY